MTFAFLLFSCASKVSFIVSKPSQLRIDHVEMMSMGNFENRLGTVIPLPNDGDKATKKGVKTKGKAQLSKFISNKKANEIVRAQLVAALSREKQYGLLHTNGGTKGVFLKPDVTAVVDAKIKYFEYSLESSEKMFYVLMLTNNNLDVKTSLMLEGIKAAAVAAAKKNKKGFMVATPFVEKIGAMEVEFSLTRKSTGKPIVPPQTFQSYYVKKWGGEAKSSTLPRKIKELILQQNQEWLSKNSTVAGKMKLGLVDPTFFLALGGNLKDDTSIPLTSLDIKTRLAEQITEQYLKRISAYTEVTSLEIQGGDAIAENYLRGSAYEKAINRLESLPERSLDDTYNLALAYESIGENHQAEKYYQEALQQEPDDTLYRNALKRVKR